MAADLYSAQRAASERRPAGTWVWVPFPSTSTVFADYPNFTHTPPAAGPTSALNTLPDSSDAMLQPSAALPPADYALGTAAGVADSWLPTIPAAPQPLGADMATMADWSSLQTAADELLADQLSWDYNLETADLSYATPEPFLLPSLDQPLAHDTWDELMSLAIEDLADQPTPAASVISPASSSYSPTSSISPPSSSPPWSHPTPLPASLPSDVPPSPVSEQSGRALAFRCPVAECRGAAFPTAHQLAKHSRRHTRPFACDVCGKGHAAKKDLHRHLWANHPDVAAARGVPCDLRTCPVPGCGFKGRQDNVARHARTRHRKV